MKAIPFHTVTLLWVAATLCGCGLNKPYPAKEFYSIDVGTPSAIASNRSDAGLRVANIRIAPPFDGESFQYMTAPNRFEADYYVNFITQPSVILSGELVRYLASAGPYSVTVDAASSAMTTRTLEARVSALYGDYNDMPKAVVTAKFFLLDTESANAKVLFDKEYTQSVSIGEADSAALVEGWARALGQIFERLSQDLAAVEAAP